MANCRQHFRHNLRATKKAKEIAAHHYTGNKGAKARITGTHSKHENEQTIADHNQEKAKK